MTAFANTRTLWTYTDDNTNTLPFRALTGYTAQVSALGGAAWTSTGGEPARRGMKLRAVYVKTAGGVRRKIVVFTPAAYAALEVNTTSLMVDIGDGIQTAATVISREGEHHQGGGLRT